VANQFLMDFAVARCRQVRTFQALTRQKTRKFIAAGLVGSTPVRLRIEPLPLLFSKQPRFIMVRQEKLTEGVLWRACSYSDP